jgi:hypothetical protein
MRKVALHFGPEPASMAIGRLHPGRIAQSIDRARIVRNKKTAGAVSSPGGSLLLGKAG